MSGAGLVRGELVGDRKLLATLRLYPKRIKPELRKAANAAATPVLRTSRRLAPVGTSTGSNGQPRKPLKKTLTKRQKTYRNGTIIVVIGPKKGEAPHAHLVHDGTAPHLINSSKSSAVLISGKWVTGVIKHPGAQPRPFLKRAVIREAPAAQRAWRRKIAEGVNKAAATSRRA